METRNRLHGIGRSNHEPRRCRGDERADGRGPLGALDLPTTAVGTAT
jgi:hypothetical protein